MLYGPGASWVWCSVASAATAELHHFIGKFGISFLVKMRPGTTGPALDGRQHRAWHIIGTNFVEQTNAIAIVSSASIAYTLAGGTAAIWAGFLKVDQPVR